VNIGLRSKAVLTCLLFLFSTNASIAARWTTFHDGRGFSISYPSDWVADPNFADLNYPDNDGNRARIEGLGLKPSIDLQPYTTLQNGQTELAVEVLPRYANACTAENFLAQQPPDYESGVDKEAPTFAHMSGSDPGGWYSYEDFVYVLSLKPCLAVHYFVAYATPGGEIAKDERPFDLGSLLSRFNKIRATIKIKRR
jgi:hypothetical protein